MALAKKQNVGINLPPLNLQLMEVTIIGDQPLIAHAWSEKARKEILDTVQKKPKGAKEAKDPLAEFEAAMYRLADGGHGFPSVAFKAAAVTAGTSVSGVTKIEIRQAFQIVGDDADVKGVFEGSVSRVNLVRIEGAPPRMREDMTRVGMGKADLRYRPEFSNWHAKLLVRYNANVLSPEQILNLLNVGGFAVGVGEWRPERNGQYGTFHVATEAEIKKLETPAKKLRRAA